ncbi:MAG: MarR family winged helix-turn-helix transcriptional regulator [Naasia sp.]
MTSQPLATGTSGAIESIEQSFGSLFRFVKANLHDSAAKLDPELQPTAWSVMRNLLRDSPLPVGSLAAAMGVDKSVVSRQVKDLRERGLVETVPSADDARVVMVSPTALAIERAGVIAEENRARYRTFLETWSEDELTEFARLLDRFSHITDWRDAPAGKAESSV